MAQREVTLDHLTTISLFVQVLHDGNVLGSATGFVVEHGGAHFLITNWHVVAGRHADTGDPLGNEFPTHLRIWHHTQSLGTWEAFPQALIDESGESTWLEHPRRREIDVVAVPIDPSIQGIQLFPLDLSLANTDLATFCAMPIHIIGFPLGLSAGGRFPVWKTGHVASEPELDINAKPVFLIDATTRGGMSGSPVVARQIGSYLNRSGNLVVRPGAITRFLGVYSGRLEATSEIGRVWKPDVISAILESV